MLSLGFYNWSSPKVYLADQIGVTLVYRQVSYEISEFNWILNRLARLIVTEKTFHFLISSCTYSIDEHSLDPKKVDYFINWLVEFNVLISVL
jgi:hypothetical protein